MPLIEVLGEERVGVVLCFNVGLRLGFPILYPSGGVFFYFVVNWIFFLLGSDRSRYPPEFFRVNM